MRIVDRQTFLALPAGTVYAKYEPCFFESISIKGDTLYGAAGEPTDWFYLSLNDPSFVGVHDCGAWTGHLDSIEAGNTSAALEEVEGRDGCFDQSQLFAIWEPDDVRFLICLLKGALQKIGAPPTRSDT